jgi:cytochrome c biogenesis protein CcmG, thiol:disulfide interchange protein DsbE
MDDGHAVAGAQGQGTDQPTGGGDTPPRRGVSRMYAFPLIIFAFIATAFAIGLTMNPSDIPSALLNKQAPEFALPPVKGRTLGLASTDLVGQVSLVNVFASWCTACLLEHPLFMGLKRRGLVDIYGINYKDKPDDASEWLDRLGDPYIRTGADLNGRVSIDWGVYGVPETFVIDKTGRIIYKHIGAIDAKAMENVILPLVRKLQAQ